MAALVSAQLHARAGVQLSRTPRPGRSSGWVTSVQSCSSSSDRTPGRECLADPCCWRAVVFLCRRHHGRDRLLARHLAGRLAAARVVGKVRGSAESRKPNVAVPERLVDGIRLENVSFGYPGSDRLAVENISFQLPAGWRGCSRRRKRCRQVHLVKLLAKMYEPTAGRITIDGRPLDRMPSEAMAATVDRGLPRLLPLRVKRSTQRGTRRPTAAGRRTRRDKRSRPGGSSRSD